jgi:rhodanese-related sulfurtransferase
VIARLMGLRTITPRALHERIQEDRLTIVDVNAAARWADAHVPGARHLDPLAFAEADLPSDKDAPLVFYCSNLLCRKAPNAARRAERMGYRHVLVLSSGIAGWLDAGLPTQSS